MQRAIEPGPIRAANDFGVAWLIAKHFTEKLILPFQVVNEGINESGFLESRLLALRDFGLIFLNAL
jgi:hypothetical protein